MLRSYETERLVLMVLDEDSTSLVLDYYERNKEFLAKWEPKKDEVFYSMSYQAALLGKEKTRMENGEMLKLWVFKKDDEQKIIGTVVFNNIVKGAFCSCHLGYKMDATEINKGYATEAIQKGIDIVFGEYELHRIEANIMPQNIRSMRVVEKLGFYYEGLAYKYLKINGKWEDHIHMVLLNEEM